MPDVGVFVQQWPAVFGCDVADEVHEVRPNVERFKKGDRVIKHTVDLVSGRPQDGGYALYTVVPDGKPSLNKASPVGKTLIVYGGSSSVGSVVTQVATAADIHVIAIVGKHNFDLSKRSGAGKVFDYKDTNIVNNVVEAVKRSSSEFIGIFDAIATAEPYAIDLAILEKLGGGHLACSLPPPNEVLGNVQTGIIFAVNDIATPVWKDYVTPALEADKPLCLPPPTVVGRDLKFVQEALKKSSAGVSGTKLVVEL